MKKFHIFLLILSLLVGDCTGMSYICNAHVNDETSNNTTVTDRLERIKKKGVLTIASSNNAPYSFIDTKTGKLTGIDGDIINEVAKLLGINKVEMKYVPFDKLFTQIQEDDDIDMIVDATYITDERKKLVSFTNPWYKDYDIFVTPKISKITFKEDLKNEVIGVQTGTIDVPFAEKLKQEGAIKDYILFPNQLELLSAVNYGKVAAGISDAINFPYLLQQNKNLYLKAVYEDPSKPDLPGETAAAVRHSDTNLLNAVNEKVDELKRDKTFSKILKKYGLDDSYIIPPSTTSSEASNIDKTPLIISCWKFSAFRYLKIE